MWNGQVGRAVLEVAEQQNIEIDHSWPPVDIARNLSKCGLDVLQPTEQLEAIKFGR